MLGGPAATGSRRGVSFFSTRPRPSGTMQHVQRRLKTRIQPSSGWATTPVDTSDNLYGPSEPQYGEHSHTRHPGDGHAPQVDDALLLGVGQPAMMHDADATAMLDPALSSGTSSRAFRNTRHGTAQLSVPTMVLVRSFFGYLAVGLGAKTIGGTATDGSSGAAKVEVVHR